MNLNSAREIVQHQMYNALLFRMINKVEFLNSWNGVTFDPTFKFEIGNVLLKPKLCPKNYFYLLDVTQTVSRGHCYTT